MWLFYAELKGDETGAYDMPETVSPSVRFVEGREGREADRSSAPAAFGDRS